MRLGMAGFVAPAMSGYASATDIRLQALLSDDVPRSRSGSQGWQWALAGGILAVPCCLVLL